MCLKSLEVNKNKITIKEQKKGQCNNLIWKVTNKYENYWRFEFIILAFSFVILTNNIVICCVKLQVYDIILSNKVMYRVLILSELVH